MSSSKNNDQKENQDAPPPSIIEWIIRATCLMTVLSLIGYFLYNGVISTGDVAVNFEFNASDAEMRNGAWVMPVSITNDSEIGVQQFTVEAVLKSDGQEIVKQLSNPILGAKEAVNAEFWFDVEPKREKIKFNVVSYVVP